MGFRLPVILDLCQDPIIKDQWIGFWDKWNIPHLLAGERVQNDITERIC